MPRRSIDLPELMERFQSEDKCRIYLEDLRWPNGVACLRCGSLSVSRIQTRHIFECSSCRYQFSVRTGTVLQDSKLALSKWLLTVFIMVESKKGVSSLQLKGMVGVGYQTAWHLTHRIRSALRQVPQPQLSSKRRSMKRGGSKGHQTERDGEVRMKVTPNLRKATLDAFIREQVSKRAEAIYADESRPNEGIADERTHHETVNHSVIDDSRSVKDTDSIETRWSLFNRSIMEPYRKLSKKHLAAYLDEMEWRFNNRDNPYLFRDTVRALLAADPLEYRDLAS